MADPWILHPRFPKRFRSIIRRLAREDGLTMAGWVVSVVSQFIGEREYSSRGCMDKIETWAGTRHSRLSAEVFAPERGPIELPDLKITRTDNDGKVIPIGRLRYGECQFLEEVLGQFFSMYPNDGADD